MHSWGIVTNGGLVTVSSFFLRWERQGFVVFWEGITEDTFGCLPGGQTEIECAVVIEKGTGILLLP